MIYVEVTKTNMVIGIGTTLHKFIVNGEPIWLPCLSYHLPSAQIRLFSPQTYHTLYGGHRVVQGKHVDIYVDEHRIDIPINCERANVPVVTNSVGSSKETSEIGPQI